MCIRDRSDHVQVGGLARPRRSSYQKKGGVCRIENIIVLSTNVVVTTVASLMCRNQSCCPWHPETKHLITKMRQHIIQSILINTQDRNRNWKLPDTQKMKKKIYSYKCKCNLQNRTLKNIIQWKHNYQHRHKQKQPSFAALTFTQTTSTGNPTPMTTLD